MSNTINPYTTTRAHLQQRPEPNADQEDEPLSGEFARSDKASKAQSSSNSIQANKLDSLEETEKLNNLQEVDEATSSTFVNTLEGAIDRKEDISLAPDTLQPGASLPGLSPDEQNMIYRYFPESPSLELRLYKPDMSTNKVDPGSVGSRVDLRG